MHGHFRSFAGAIALSLAPMLVAGGLDTPAAWASPLPVSGLVLSALDAGYVGATWTVSTSTAASRVCYAVTTPPASPADAGATCSDILANSSTWSFAGTAGTTYGVSAFSYDTGTAEYGPPVSATITATDRPPLAPVNLRTEPLSQWTTSKGWDWRSIGVGWSENPTNKLTWDYLVSWAPGLTTPGVPPADAAHASRESEFVIQSLQANRVYTIAVRVRDSAGQVGPPAVVRATTRQPGVWVADDNHTRSAIVETTSPIYSGMALTEGAALLQPDGTVRIALVCCATGPDNGRIVIMSRAVRTGWGTAKFGRLYVHSPLIAQGPGILVVAWTSPNGVYYWIRTSRWTAIPVLVSGTSGDTVVGLATDSRHRVHLLLRHAAGAAQGLYYVTIVGTRIYRALVPSSHGADSGLLARDPASDRIVVVLRRSSATDEIIKVKTIASSATTVGSLPWWLRDTNGSVSWQPTQIAAFGNRITLGLQRLTSSGSRLADGPYVIDGTAKSHHAPVRVAGTTRVDTGLTVSAPAAGRVVLSWQRHNAYWNPDRLGIWLSTRVYRASSGRWAFTSPRHWTRSAYDRPLGAFADARGHLYALYIRDRRDVRQ